MKTLIDNDTIQIEITNVCNRKCGNCTRFCSLIKKPYFMPLDQVKRAVDSMIGFPHMTGCMGGEPLLHPDFEAICKYMQAKIPKKQLGLWTSLPPGKEHYAALICDVFEHIFVNDHEGPAIYHQAPLVGIQEAFTNKKEMWIHIDKCWAQASWSASINPRGAWFCEIAAALSMLFGEGKGWEIEPEWWTRIPKDYTSQMERFCPRCGFALPTDLRCSLEPHDDVSPLNYEVLREIVRNPQRLKIYSPVTATCKPQPQMAAYKDTTYRNRVAARYGIRLFINDMGFWTPYIIQKDNLVNLETRGVVDVLSERIRK
jgi:hypothetical protein